RAGCHGERMARRPIGELQPPAVEKCVLADEHGVGSLASKHREAGVNLATRTGVEDLKLQYHGAAGRFHLAQGDLRVGSIGGLMSTATRAVAGSISRSSSSRFAVNSRPIRLTPVRLPLGRARLVTRPNLTGSSETLNTMGMVAVAPLAASAVAKPPAVAITATCRRTSWPANSGSCSIRSPHRSSLL